MIYKAIKHSKNDEHHQQLSQLLYDSFDCIKRSLILIPKLSYMSIMTDKIKDSLQESFNAVASVII